MTRIACGVTPKVATVAAAKCRSRALWGLGLATVAVLLAPATALAHGPVNPAASSYLATVGRVPAGVQAKVVDGDLRMWMQAGSNQTVVVLDYRGAPYLRFSPAGVEVNHNSSMYYLNQVPAELIPSNIGPDTPPHWVGVSGGHAYEWHDGRLHALATTALAPGARYVGEWRIPLRVDGTAAAITGALTYAPDPSVVWFWPILVALACVFAGLRVRSRTLDLGMARALAATAIVAFVIAAFGEQLHGRPSVSIGQLIVLVLELAFAAWAVRGLVLGRLGWFGFFLIALAALFEGATLIGVLLHGFVLIALPAVIARLTVIVCLASGAALIPIIFRLAEPAQRVRGVRSEPAWDEDSAWELDT